MSSHYDYCTRVIAVMIPKKGVLHIDLDLLKEVGLKMKCNLLHRLSKQKWLESVCKLNEM